MRKRFLALFLLLAPVTGCGYNTIQSLSQTVDQAQGNIQAQLQRRADLIPNLVQTVKGYAQHEDAVFTNVAQARAGLIGAIKTGDPGQMASADAQMTSTLGRLMVVAEAYPQLKADKSFMALQDELTGTENRINISREDYNGAVKAYNTYISQFPAVMTAKATGAKVKTYYQATAANADAAPVVDFSKTAPTPAKPPTP